MESDDFTILYSTEFIEEFLTVAERPKFEKYFSTNDIANLIEQINSVGELIEIQSDIQLCRDEKDNFLLNLAVDGKADFLITGDKDLLVIGEIEDTKILTYREFEDSLE